MAANHFGCYNYIDPIYLLKVSITGYDSSGKIYELGKGLRTRYIPIRFTDFKFGVDEKGTTYDVTAILQQHRIKKYSGKNAQVDVQIEAKTVNDFFKVAITIENEFSRSTKELDDFGGPNIVVIEKANRKRLNRLLKQIRR